MFFQMGFYFKQPTAAAYADKPISKAQHDVASDILDWLLGTDDSIVTAEAFDWGDIDDKLTSTQLNQIKQHLRDSLDAQS
jgi:predicted HD phosphohydrolase